ncbi:MAG: shikimate dehydrogenase [Clostridia bacterium]|nr:shikimate dehydrogenase [Clostridia bacterium]
MEYGCIGEHLSHSFSKEIHNALADYDYKIQEIARNDLDAFLKNADFKAINVTIPYKQDVIPYLDWISPEAETINAVNTIVNRDGKLYGYNTDFYGLKALIERENVSLKDKKVAILGSGGTSNTAFAVAKAMGAQAIRKVSRSEKDGYITYAQLYNDFSDCEIIINTTPCGMFPKIGVSPVELSALPGVEGVFDAVYNPLKSKLICDARARGIIATGGLFMLVAQAAYAVEKFINKPVETEEIEKIYKNLYKQKMNIVLIGMPASGKTTVGNLLAKDVSKIFKDTDDLIVEKENQKIPDIFSQKGEPYFRNSEKQTIADISLENSLVISTGGGAVLNSENMDFLKENGRIYFIDRPLELLVTTSDRPLSSNRQDLEKRYNERYELYLKSADVHIDGAGTVEQVADRIKDDYYEYSCN